MPFAHFFVFVPPSVPGRDPNLGQGSRGFYTYIKDRVELEVFGIIRTCELPALKVEVCRLARLRTGE